LSFGLLTGLRIGLLCGLASGLVGGLAFRQASTSIRLIETLSWSWKASRRGLGLGLLGQALGLVVGRLTRPVIGLALGLTFGLVGVLTTAALPHHSYLK